MGFTVSTQHNCSVTKISVPAHREYLHNARLAGGGGVLSEFDLWRIKKGRNEELKHTHTVKYTHKAAYSLKNFVLNGLGWWGDGDVCFAEKVICIAAVWQLVN